MSADSEWTPPHQLGRALCERWGLDPDRVASVDIHLAANECPTVHVVMYPEDLTADVLEAVGVDYRLMPYALRLSDDGPT